MVLFGAHGPRGAVLFGSVYLALAIPPVARVLEGDPGTVAWIVIGVVAVAVLAATLAVASGGDEGVGCGGLLLVLAGYISGSFVGGRLGYGDPERSLFQLGGTLLGPVGLFGYGAVMALRG